MDSRKKKPSEEKPWLQFFSEEAVRSELPDESIYDNLFRNNQSYRNSTAINYFDNHISFGTMLDEIDRTAAALQALGIGKGDIVAFCSPSVPEVAYLLYGLNKLGAALFPIDPRSTAPEVMSFVKMVRPRLFFLLDVFYEKFKDMLPELPVEKSIISPVDRSMSMMVRTLKRMKMPPPKPSYNERLLNWKDFLALGHGIKTESVHGDGNELAAITMTGGTTGRPKGVMLSNKGFNAVAHDFRHCGVTYNRRQRFLDIIPAFASYGIVASLHMPLSLGVEVVMVTNFNADKVGRMIRKYRPAHTLMVPSHYEKLMHSREMRYGYDLSFFETAGSGGDTMNVGLETEINAFLKDHGCRFPLSQGYGMSEVSSAAACSCNGNFKSLSVGYPLLTNTIGIFKPGTTEELDYNEEGEICIGGPAVMLGYFENEEENRKVLFRHPDGQVWVHSGDLGRMDEDGFIYILGRIKRMIIRFNGHKVFPTRLEDAISRIENVSNCAVIGVTDTEHAQGQVPVVVVEMKDPSIAGETRAEIEELCQNQIEEYSRPKDIWVIEDMPHQGMGKIDYSKLKQDYEALISTNSFAVS